MPGPQVSRISGEQVHNEGRVVGVDLGDHFIGIAVSDSARHQAFARSVLERTKAAAIDQKRLVEAIEECEATLVVIGLPLSLNGSAGPAAKKVLREVENLRAALDVPVVTVDERFSSVEVEQRKRLLATEQRGASRRPSAPKRKTRIDDLAAEIFLQAYLDRAANKR